MIKHHSQLNGHHMGITWNMVDLGNIPYKN